MDNRKDSAKWVIMVLLFVGVVSAKAEQSLPPKLQTEINKMKGWISDLILLSAVQNQNKMKIPLEDIQKLDRDWTPETSANDLAKTLQENECALRLKELEKKIPSAMESFVMDNQGALVCTTRRTSDYWQGDEPKWKDPFTNRKTWIGRREYDSSTKSTLMHVSVPINDQNTVVGVLCVGINLAKLAEASVP